MNRVSAAAMSIQTWDFQGINRLFGANAKRERTIEPGWLPWAFLSDVKEAQAWMQQDKANRVIEGVQRVPYGHNQVLWERVDKSKPIGFTRGGGVRWLSFYPEAEQLGGCLHNYTGDKFRKEMEHLEFRKGLGSLM